jgi:uncharacterized protein involved in exopolysaccharide biosynthesis
MNTPLKFDHEKRPDFQFEQPDSRTYYEDLASQILRSIVRRRRFVVRVVAIAFALACITVPMLPRKYSAEALIYPNLFSREQGKVTAMASVDATTLVTGEARLIRSDAFLRAVAKRLGEDAPKSHFWPRLLDWVRAAWLPETRNYSPFDRAVAFLRNKVAVMNDTRSYLISISFTAHSAEEAAQVVNSFVLEYVHDKAIQRGLDRLNSAEADLRQEQAVYGAKHPKTLQAAAELDAARTMLEAANSQDSAQDEIAGGQSVKLAVPNQTPTSPNGFVIFVLSLLFGLIAGIGLAIWLDRKEITRRQGKLYRPQ